ncbi:MAG: GNAT family N-acetyltransferase [Phycisphaerales bacterium]
MATIATNALMPGGGADEPAFAIVRVDESRRWAAVDRLIGAQGERERVESFLVRADAEGTDLSFMWALEPVGEAQGPRHVCLALRGAGRTAAMFLSGTGLSGAKAGRPDQTLRQRSALLEEACRVLAEPASGVVLAQALVGPEEQDQGVAFERAGFLRLAELAYLRRTIARGGRTVPHTLPPGLELVALSDLPPAEGKRLLREALSKSYEGTLDCPALCGMRTVDDVIASHHSVGRYDPRWWWIMLCEGQAHGCLLLSHGADPQHCELVYLGLSAVVRGRGLGAELLRTAVARLASASVASELMCAVDLANVPAMRLYKRAKFRQISSRSALVRPLCA